MLFKSRYIRITDEKRNCGGLKIQTIFVAGVHGVGKGTICNVLNKSFQLETFSASSLIKNEKKDKVDINKVVQDPDQNQVHLTNAIKKLSPNSSKILLDGHFCLNNTDRIFKVPISTFDSLNLEAIFLITEEPSIIFDRLVSRDSHSIPINLIQELQNEEIIRATAVTRHLKIPLIISQNGDIEKLLGYLYDNPS